MLASGAAAQAASSGYHVLKTVTLGGDGGWDYLNLDPATGNLFITRGIHVMVVDPDSGKVLADIAGPAGHPWHRLCRRPVPMSAKAAPTGWP